MCSFHAEDKSTCNIFICGHKIQHFHGSIRILANRGDHPAAQYRTACANQICQLILYGFIWAVCNECFDIVRAVSTHEATSRNTVVVLCYSQFIVKRVINEDTGIRPVLHHIAIITPFRCFIEVNHFCGSNAAIQQNAQPVAVPKRINADEWFVVSIDHGSHFGMLFHNFLHDFRQFIFGDAFPVTIRNTKLLGNIFPHVVHFIGCIAVHRRHSILDTSNLLRF